MSASRPGSRAISTAIGYNQLLTTNSVELLAEQGHEIVQGLTEKAGQLSGAPRKAMDHKIAVLKRMVALARSVPDEWAEHEKLGDTPQGWALHAMVLDIDVGPLLQTHKLLTSLTFARSKGYTRALTAAELEMMNLTGDGTGLDMVTMPQACASRCRPRISSSAQVTSAIPWRAATTPWPNCWPSQKARMDSNSLLPGAKELAGAF